MNDTPNPTDGSIDRVKAEETVRTMWIAFNNTGLYGGSHPLTVRSIDDFEKALRGVLGDVSSLTLHIEQEFIACEEWRIQKRAYGPRLVNRFRDAKIQSLTFYPEIGRQDLAHLLDVFNAGAEYPAVDAMAQELKHRSAKGYRFNYVTYQKVTLDESIVQRDLHAFAELLSGTSRPDEPLPEDILSAPSHVQRDTPSMLLMHLRALRERIGDTSVRSMPSTEELVDALSSLRKSVIQELQLQAARGRVADGAADMFTEVESLTFDVVLRIVREEYRKGTLSAAQLAMLVERLVPDRRDLTRLLPLLKQALLDEGMALEEYLELVRRLGRELQSEALMDALAGAGEELGVTPDEIVAEFRRNPGTAVSLILLAAEIKSAGFRNETEFAETIQRYIERVVSALDPAKAGEEHGRGARTSELALSALEAELSSQIQRHEAPARLREQVLSSLSRTGIFAGGDPGGAAGGPSGAQAGEEPGAAITGAEGPATDTIAAALRERGYGDADMRRFVSLAEEIGMVVGEDYGKLQTLLSDYLADVPAAQAEGEGEGGEIEAVDRALVALEEQFRDLLGRRGLSAERIDSLAAQLRGHLAMLAEGAGAGGHHAPATLAEDRRVVSLDAALGVRGYSEKDVARFKALAEEMKELVGPGVADTQVLLAEFLTQTGDLPVVDTGGGEDAGESSAVEEALARIEDNFLSFLSRRGLDDETIERIGDRLSHRLAELLIDPNAPAASPSPAPRRRSGAKGKLTGAVLRPKETRTHLEREIARCARYGCAFSCVSIAASRVAEGGVGRAPEGRDMVPFVNAVSERLQSALRTPDIIGTVGSVAKNHIVVLLPMSDEQGAAIAEARFRRILEGLTAEVEGDNVGIETVTSISSFAGSRAIKTGSFVRRLRDDCRAALSEHGARAT